MFRMEASLSPSHPAAGRAALAASQFLIHHGPTIAATRIRRQFQPINPLAAKYSTMGTQWSTITAAMIARENMMSGHECCVLTSFEEDLV